MLAVGSVLFVLNPLKHLFLNACFKADRSISPLGTGIGRGACQSGDLEYPAGFHAWMEELGRTTASERLADLESVRDVPEYSKAQRRSALITWAAQFSLKNRRWNLRVSYKA